MSEAALRQCLLAATTTLFELRRAAPVPAPAMPTKFPGDPAYFSFGV